MPVLNTQAVVKLYEKSHGINWHKARNCLSICKNVIHIELYNVYITHKKL